MRSNGRAGRGGKGVATGAIGKTKTLGRRRCRRSLLPPSITAVTAGAPPVSKSGRSNAGDAVAPPSSLCSDGHALFPSRNGSIEGGGGAAGGRRARTPQQGMPLGTGNVSHAAGRRDGLDRRPPTGVCAGRPCRPSLCLHSCMYVYSQPVVIVMVGRSWPQPSTYCKTVGLRCP